MNRHCYPKSELELHDISVLKKQLEATENANRALQYLCQNAMRHRRSAKHMDKVVDRLFNTAMFFFVAAVILAFATGTI